MRLLAIGSSTVTSVFDLLGRKENDLTYAVGWCLAESPAFLRHFVAQAGGLELGDVSDVELQLQNYDRDDLRVTSHRSLRKPIGTGGTSSHSTWVWTCVPRPESSPTASWCPLRNGSAG